MGRDNFTTTANGGSQGIRGVLGHFNKLCVCVSIVTTFEIIQKYIMIFKANSFIYKTKYKA